MMAAVGWTGFMLFLLLNISMGRNLESSVSHLVGQTVTLPCHHHHTTSGCSTVFWLFNSNSNPFQTIGLVAHGKVTDTQRPGRLTVGFGCSLQIKNLNTEDAGWYFCRLHHNKDEYTPISTVSLSVSERQNPERSSVSCNVGQAVILPCEPTMSDCSMVFWLFSPNPFESIELVAYGKVKDTQRPERLTVGFDCSLWIKNLNTEDAGQYSCQLYHDNEDCTDISAASLFVGDINKTSCIISLVSPSTVSPTVTKRDSTTAAVSPSTVSPRGSAMSTVELSVRLVVFFIILIFPPIIGVIYTKSRNHRIRDQVSSGTELQEYVNG